MLGQCNTLQVCQLHAGQVAGLAARPCAAAHLDPAPRPSPHISLADFGTQINGRIVDSAFTVAFNPRYDPLLQVCGAGMCRALAMVGGGPTFLVVQGGLQKGSIMVPAAKTRPATRTHASIPLATRNFDRLSRMPPTRACGRAASMCGCAILALPSRCGRCMCLAWLVAWFARLPGLTAQGAAVRGCAMPVCLLIASSVLQLGRRRWGGTRCCWLRLLLPCSPPMSQCLCAAVLLISHVQCLLPALQEVMESYEVELDGKTYQVRRRGGGLVHGTGLCCVLGRKTTCREEVGCRLQLPASPACTHHP